MNQNRLSRRRFIAGAGAAISTAVTTSGITVARGASKTTSKRTTPFSYCINTSSIRGQKLSLEREIEITAKAGYGAIEPWVSKIHEYAKGGGNLNELRRRISDLGLTVESAISFPAGLWTTMPSVPKLWNKTNGTWTHWPGLAASESRHLRPVLPERQGSTL